ncbi:MAG TPA: hypothetical protein PKE57_01725 [Cellvibrionaceae bacterium]|nr:hypothetical protein [Cellvibrionaceae bacterium]
MTSASCDAAEIFSSTPVWPSDPRRILCANRRNRAEVITFVAMFCDVKNGI